MASSRHRPTALEDKRRCVRASLNVTGASVAALGSIALVTAEVPPPTLRRSDIARLLNVTGERARQVTKGGLVLGLQGERPGGHQLVEVRYTARRDLPA